MDISHYSTLETNDFSFGNSQLEKNHKRHGCINCRAAKFCLPALCLPNKCSRNINDLIERRRIIRQREHLVHKEDPQKYLYAVHSGCCKGYYVDNSGREHVSNFFYPGDIVGLESIFFEKFLINIVALDTCDICYINLSKFKTFLQDSPETREQLINIFSQQLWLSYSMSGTYNAQELVIKFLLNLSHHAKILGESETELTLSMGRHDIANYLGLSSETVSRVMTRLKTQALIDVDRNFIKLCDLPQLNELATSNDL